MPQGTHHRLNGVIRWTIHGFAIFADDGAYWILDVPWRFRKFARRQLDQRVFIAGTRWGFNDLTVTEMRLFEQPGLEPEHGCP